MTLLLITPATTSYSRNIQYPEQLTMETIYYNGIVITGASTQDLSNRHDCLIVKDDLITHIGSRGSTVAENAMQDERTQKVDVGGRMVLPGFVDG